MRAAGCSFTSLASAGSLVLGSRRWSRIRCGVARQPIVPAASRQGGRGPAEAAYAVGVNPAQHWERIYVTRPPDGVGWYEADPLTSRRLIADAVARGAESVLDVGGGASTLVDHLLDLGLQRVAVLDISDAGLAVSRRRLGDRSAGVEWIVAGLSRSMARRPASLTLQD